MEMAHSKFIAVAAILLVSQSQIVWSQSVQQYNISTPISVESVACCSTTDFFRISFHIEAAPVITRALCLSVGRNLSNEPPDIVNFCGNSNSIRGRNVRLTEIMDHFNSTRITTYCVYAIASFDNSYYVVNGDIVAQSLNDSTRIGQLSRTTCEPLNRASPEPPDEYNSPILTGINICSSVVLVLELIIVGIFTSIQLDFGMGQQEAKTSPTCTQEVVEGIVETITGL